MDPYISSDSRVIGDDAGEEAELPDRAEQPLEKNDEAGEDAGSEPVMDRSGG